MESFPEPPIFRGRRSHRQSGINPRWTATGRSTRRGETCAERSNPSCAFCATAARKLSLLLAIDYARCSAGKVEPTSSPNGGWPETEPKRTLEGWSQKPSGGGTRMPEPTIAPPSPDHPPASNLLRGPMLRHVVESQQFTVPLLMELFERSRAMERNALPPGYERTLREDGAADHPVG